LIYIKFTFYILPTYSQNKAGLAPAPSAPLENCNAQAYLGQSATPVSIKKLLGLNIHSKPPQWHRGYEEASVDGVSVHSPSLAGSA
jgi:hypothetical protein